MYICNLYLVYTTFKKHGKKGLTEDYILRETYSNVLKNIFLSF